MIKKMYETFYIPRFCLNSQEERVSNLVYMMCLTVLYSSNITVSSQTY